MKEAYKNRGYHIERSIFSAIECKKILKGIRSDKHSEPLVWEKGGATSIPSWASLARNDKIVDIVSGLAGENLILWGASLIERVPEQVHQWHDDLESCRDGEGFVSVWIGLKETVTETSLKVIPGSHQFGKSIYELAKENNVPFHAIENQVILEWSNRIQAGTNIEYLDTTNGDALFFDGRLWHGSRNRSKNRLRKAVLLQYARVDKTVRIPKFGHNRWPIEYYKAPKPPCLIVRGSSGQIPNDIVPGPHANTKDKTRLITNIVEPMELREGEPGRQTLKSLKLLNGATPELRYLECHYSILAAGKSPHPPHIHDEEEIQMLVVGKADMIAEDKKGSNAMVRYPSKPGDFIYHPANWRHTYENTSKEPCVCAIIKWKTDEYHSERTLISTFIRSSEALQENLQSPDAVDFNLLMKGKTSYLRTLQAHRTTLQPGHGYDPHVDAHDVGIIIMKGTVETLGETITGPAFIYYAAGQKHGMKNVGATPSQHITFEFHGKHGDMYEPAKYRRRRKLIQSIREPGILINHLKWVFNHRILKKGVDWPPKEGL